MRHSEQAFAIGAAGASRVVRILVGVAIATGASGCAVDASSPSATEEKVAGIGTDNGFVAWRDSLPVEWPSGYRIVEDDMPMPDARLREYFDQHFGPQSALILDTTPTATQWVWDATNRKNLTYCISNHWNAYGGSAKQTIINIMSWAGQQWQAATHNAVTFRYVPSEDANCTNTNTNVLFNVDVNLAANCPGKPGGNCCPSVGGNCSFYPDQNAFPRANRILFFGPGIVTTDPVSTQFGNAAHELGHILGFGHESSWLVGTGLTCGAPPPAPPSLAENQYWAPLTRFDTNSIMYFSGCPGAGPTADLQLSTYDIRGASCAYEGLCEWIQLAGANSVSDIDIDASANVWSFSNVIKDGGGNFLQKWNHSTLRWDTTPTPTGGKRLTVDPTGLPWYVTTTGDIYRAMNGGIARWPGSATDISIGANGTLWAVTNQPVGGGSFKIAKWSGSWVVQNGIDGFHIAVDRNGAPFVVRPDGSLFHLENGSWNLWPGSVFDVDAGSDGSVWVIAKNGTIWQWVVNHWELVTGAGIGIAVAQNGQPWVIGYENATYVNRWVP